MGVLVSAAQPPKPTPPSSALGDAAAQRYAATAANVRLPWKQGDVAVAMDGLCAVASNRAFRGTLGFPIRDRNQKPCQGVSAMLTTMERVLVLKSVAIFRHTPEEVLSELADLLDECDHPADTPIFAKGDPGASLYIIVRGSVRVHDGDYELNRLGEREVFGEMALLDPAPRAASVTTSEDSLLLCLEQDTLYELMEERIEVARGLIVTLIAYLRERIGDLNAAWGEYQGRAG
jgi:CRP/FNR family cyclic AMP-dependent transcriptional regulator